MINYFDIDVDIIISTPDMMHTIGKVGKVLGTKGLMPNPKLGTVTHKIGDAVKISSIKLPEGVTPTISDRDFVIATLVPPTVEVETKSEEETTEEGEATSEKNAFGHYFDGKVSAILGSHTHIPTADARILDGGTAYQTDVGMTGVYNSVIGMDKDSPIHGFIKGYRSEGRFFPAEGEVTICGTYIETDDNTGISLKIEPFKI